MENLSQKNWTHYLYIIQFEDGCFYTGVSKRKGDDPLIDGYYGSSTAKKHKDRWESIKHEKEIVAFLWCESHSEAYSIETEWQKRNYSLNDPKCMNERFGSTNFSDDSQKQGGKTQGNLNVRYGLGFWDPEVQSNRNTFCSKGGLRGGRSAVESGQLAEAREKAFAKTRKPIILTKDGIDTIYPSVQEAARSIGGFASAISLVANGKRNHHLGYTAKWTS